MPHSSVRTWLARALAEAALVVFAVLLALAVDAWWQQRQDARLAVRTLEAIAGEIRRNRERLLPDPGTAALADHMPGLDAAVAAFRAGRDPPEVAVNWDIVLLSGAAWETAQLTRTTQHMDLATVMELAEVYELQRLFTRRQDELASLISDLGARMETEPVVALTRVRSHLQHTLAIRETLATVYGCTLVRLEGAQAVDGEACPRDGGPGPG